MRKQAIGKAVLVPMRSDNLTPRHLRPFVIIHHRIQEDVRNPIWPPPPPQEQSFKCWFQNASPEVGLIPVPDTFIMPQSRITHVGFGIKRNACIHMKDSTCNLKHGENAVAILIHETCIEQRSWYCRRSAEASSTLSNPRCLNDGLLIDRQRTRRLTDAQGLHSMRETIPRQAYSSCSGELLTTQAGLRVGNCLICCGNAKTLTSASLWEWPCQHAKKERTDLAKAICDARKVCSTCLAVFVLLPRTEA